MSNQDDHNHNLGGDQEDDLTNLMNFAQENDQRESDLYQQAAVLQQLYQQQQQLATQQQQQQLVAQQQQQQHKEQNAVLHAQLNLKGISQPIQQTFSQKAEVTTNQENQEPQYQQTATQVPGHLADQHSNMQFQVLANPFVLHQGLPRDHRVTQRPFNGRANLNERECFFIFVKILLKLMANNPSLRSRAKAIIGECTKRNRMGDIDYVPLQDAVERRLKGCMGESYWTRAKLFFNAYCERNGIQQPISLPPIAPV